MLLIYESERTYEAHSLHVGVTLGGTEDFHRDSVEVWMNFGLTTFTRQKFSLNIASLMSASKSECEVIACLAGAALSEHRGRFRQCATDVAVAYGSFYLYST